MKHFATKKEATRYIEEKGKFLHCDLNVFKKVKGQRNKTKKPFVVCSELEFLNLY